MRKLFMSAAVALALTVGGASAGNLDNPYARPPVIEPQCMHFGWLPCHTLFDYVEPEGDEPRISRPNDDDDVPNPPRCGGVKDRKDKGKSKGKGKGKGKGRNKK